MNAPDNLIVMYHYVRPDGAEIPGGIRPLRTCEFERQLDWLSERYQIVGADDFLARIDAAGSKPLCLLTFDDGTKDHHEVVMPILVRRGLSGVFFILSGPAEHGMMPLTHALHWLLGNDEQLVWDLFANDAGTSLGDPAEAARIYHYETPIRARIKYAVNMVLPAEVGEGIVQAAVKAAGRTMEDLAKEWFVSDRDIQSLHAAGMTIAMHGCSHRSLQMLGGEGIRKEILHCSHYLTRLTGKKPTWYACPFGGSGASAIDVAAMKSAMIEAGAVAAVSTEKKYVSVGADRFALSRFDTIDLPWHRRPPGVETLSDTGETPVPRVLQTYAAA